MKTKIIIVLSALVVGLAGFLLYESLNTEMSEVEIKAQFSDLKSEYKQMQGDIELAIKNVEIKDEEIIAQKAKIDSLMRKEKITEEELQKAKVIMKNLANVVLKSYQKRLKSLDDRSNFLTKEVKIGEEKIIVLEHRYTEEKNKSEKKDQIIKQKDIIIKSKDEQINQASRLILSNFTLTGFKVRSSGKEIQTDKASRIDRIKVSFDIITNPLTASGKKQIYTIIKKPSGEIVSFENKPVGTFIYQNHRMRYSDEMVFDYRSGEEKTLEFAWDNEDFERGNYTMEIYEKMQNGVVLIGKTIKSLR